MTAPKPYESRVQRRSEFFQALGAEFSMLQGATLAEHTEMGLRDLSTTTRLPSGFARNSGHSKFTRSL
jgi:hypothetical protein